MFKRILSLLIIFLVCITFYVDRYEKTEAVATEIVIGGIIVTSAVLAVGTSLLVAGGARFDTDTDARNATIGMFSAQKEILNQCMSAITLTGIAADYAGKKIAQVSGDLWTRAKQWMFDNLVPNEYKFVDSPMSSFEIGGISYPSYDAPISYNQYIGMTDGVITPDYIATAGAYPYATGQQVLPLFNNVKYGGSNGWIAMWDGVYQFVNPKMYLRTINGELWLVCAYMEKGSIFKTYALANGSAYFPYTCKWNPLGATAQAQDFRAFADSQVSDLLRDYASNDNTRGICVYEDTVVGRTAQDVAVDYDFGTNAPYVPIDDPNVTDRFGILATLGLALNGINSWLTNDFMTGYNDLVNGLNGTISKTIDGIGSKITDWWDGVKATFNDIKLGIIAFPLAISTAFSDLFKVESLDFSGFQSLVVYDKFPFSIPFDFIDAIKVFSQSAQQPTFVIDIDTEFLKVYHEIDLSPYSFYIGFFRYFVVIVFTFILIFVTSKFIQW